jgi:hypothetical protein
LAVTLGLFWDASQKKKSPAYGVITGGAAVLFGIAAIYSFSRAAVLAVIAISCFTPVIWLWVTRRQFTVTRWVNAVLLGAVIVIALALGVVGIQNGAVIREFEARSVIGEDLQNYDGSRGSQISPALEIFKEHPLFGVGGWGYRKFVLSYLSREQLKKHQERGKANVHCDPVQFLAEHGIVGAGLMSGALAALLWPWRRFRHWRFKGLAMITAFGSVLVFLHSLIDLPFRNPTVLWHWLLLLALVPVLSEIKPGQSKNQII